MTTAQKADALPVVAWRYKTAHTTHLCHSRLDHYFSNDEGKTYIKGDALVLQADHEASLLAKEADTDRLDWMDKNPGRIKHSIGYRGAPDSWVWTDNSGYGHDAANLRAAIDAARAAADQGGA